MSSVIGVVSKRHGSCKVEQRNQQIRTGIFTKQDFIKIASNMFDSCRRQWENIYSIAMEFCELMCICECEFM